MGEVSGGSRVGDFQGQRLGCQRLGCQMQDFRDHGEDFHEL